MELAESHSREEHFIQKLTQIVLDNLTNEQFSVEELAVIYGISRSQLHKKLKKVTRKSVSQFIREIRLEEAMKMLQQDAATVSEIAYQVGFSGPTYFNTSFKDYYGYPPGEVKLRAHLDKDLTSGSRGNQPPVSKLRKRKTVFLIVIGALLALVTLSFLLISRTPSKPDLATDEAIGADSIPQEKTIAVLPLKNWSGDPELEYISDGMTDAVISRLANIESIKKVVPFTSMVSYKKTDKSIAEIARELGVKNILQGSFQLSGDDVSIKLQMLDGTTEHQFWDNEYNSTWKSDEIFELQATVAENVAENIDAQITESEQNTIQYVPTSNTEAYRLYLLAEYQFGQLTVKGIENARTLYESAIALDSTFIEPYIRLALLYKMSEMVYGINSEKEAWSKAKPLYEKALEIDQLNSKAFQKVITYDLLSGNWLFEWDFKGIENNYNSAELISGKIKNPPFGDYARKTGRFKDALAITNIYMKESPTFSGTYVSKAALLYFLNRQEEAKELLAKYDDLYDRDYCYLMESSKYYHYLGVKEKSKKHLDLFKNQFPDRPPIILWLDAIHAEMNENTDRANTNLRLLEDLYQQKASGSPAWFIALYYCHIKDYDSAFEWLRKSYSRHEMEMSWLKEEPVLRPLKNDPRYLELYEKVGFSILDQ